MFGYLYYLLISKVSIYCVILYKYNWGGMGRGLFRLQALYTWDSLSFCYSVFYVQIYKTF